MNEIYMRDMVTKILLYDWHSNSQLDLGESLAALDDRVQMYSFSEPLADYEEDGLFQQKLADKIKEQDIQICFSFDYFPVISRVCMEQDILYISWIYDCPHVTLYSRTAQNPCNLIFSFDRKQVEELRGRGIHQVRHMPLAVNTRYLDLFLRTITKQAPEEVLQRQYGAQISFVGSIYEQNYYESIPYLPPELKGYIEGICQAQKHMQGMELVRSLLSEEKIDEIKDYVKLEEDARYEVSYGQLFCDLFLAKYISSLERKDMLQALADRYPVKLYSESDWTCPGLEAQGAVDYRRQMPIVFSRTGCNLNMTIRSISSGIPLRCLDIMGAGGTLFSNTQPELLEYFDEGEEFIGFGNREELLDKVSFYLDRETLCGKIAQRGQRKVREQFNYHRILNRILDIADTYL